MINLHKTGPAVPQSEDSAILFETRHLRAALERAAGKAGYSSWWVAEDLTTSVGLFLKLRYPEEEITGRKLDGAVKSALRKIGYPEIARFFACSVARQRISLLGCVPPKPNCDFARFLENLSARIDSQRGTGGLLHFHGLPECVSRLQAGSAGTGHRDSHLQEIVVAFVRDRLKAPGSSVGCQCIID